MIMVIFVFRGYANKKGQVVIPYKYDLAEKFDYYGVAKVYIGSLPKDAAQTEAT